MTSLVFSRAFHALPLDTISYVIIYPSSYTKRSITPGKSRGWLAPRSTLFPLYASPIYRRLVIQTMLANSGQNEINVDDSSHAV